MTKKTNTQANSQVTTAPEGAISAQLTALAEYYQPAPAATQVTVIKSVKEQKAELSADIDGLSKGASAIKDAAERFHAFCVIGNNTGWSFTVDRTMLCGKKDGTVQGVGMTDAEYQTLKDRLSALSYSLIAFTAAKMRLDSASEQKAIDLTAQVKRHKNSAFLSLKAIKTTFNIDVPCTSTDIDFLSAKAVNLVYKDKGNIKAGYTFKPVGVNSLLNTVLRYCRMAGRAKSIEGLTAINNTTSIYNTIYNLCTAELKALAESTAQTGKEAEKA